MPKYDYDDQPYNFVFYCDKVQCNQDNFCDCDNEWCIKSKEDGNGCERKQQFYCGKCGIERSKQKQINQKYLFVEQDIYNYSFLSMMIDPEQPGNPDKPKMISTLPE